MRVLTPDQMRAVERYAIEERGLPARHLMERAGAEVAAALDRHLGDRLRAPVTVLGGRGNNGGDAWVAARQLRVRGCEVQAVLVGSIGEVAGDARRSLDEARRAGVPIAEAADGPAWDLVRPGACAAGLIVDGLYGTGLSRPLTGLSAAVVRDVNAAGRAVAAIDLPSGLLPGAAGAAAVHVRARLTVALAAPKVVLVLRPEAAGRLVVADIGIPPDVIDRVGGPRILLPTPAEIGARVPRRAPDAHKGRFGRIVIAAGSRGLTGAARLAGLGALRAGAGLVTVAAPASCLGMIAQEPEYMTIGLPDRDGVVTGAGIDRLLEAPCDVLAAGPGLGTGAGPRTLVEALLDQPSAAPLVLDADALTVCAGRPGGIRGRRSGPIVLTPHPGELARLTGVTVDRIQRDRIDAARRCAAAHGVHVVLKGARTVIADPAGGIVINPTGNPGMATGGSGDVLTGATAAWLGQVDDVGAAVVLAVYLHGLAGDLAARALGETGVIARDIARRLGVAVTQVTGRAAAAAAGAGLTDDDAGAMAAAGAGPGG